MERSEMTTGSAPLPRPYVDQGDGPQYPVPVPPRPQFTPRPQPAPPPRFIPRQAPVRPIIGDELRIPIMWCEFSTCIERFTHVDALGEQDLRDRALAAGWRYDLLGRLACPSCQQHDPTFWMTRPPVPAQRYRRLPADGRRPTKGMTGRQNCPG
jgi:hypothetical protein